MFLCIIVCPVHFELSYADGNWCIRNCQSTLLFIFICVLLLCYLINIMLIIDTFHCFQMEGETEKGWGGGGRGEGIQRK